MNITKLIAMIDPDIYESLKKAVEIGKWKNGTVLTAEQKELCMQAIIAYDIKHKPEHERVGYVASMSDSCGKSDLTETTELRPVRLPDH